MSQQVSIITGAARGIGRATAVRLAQDGWAVVVNGRSDQELTTLVTELGENAVPVIADLLDSETPRKLVDTALSKFGRLDALVNSAGVAKHGPLLDMTLETWNGFFDLHVTATFRCCQAAGRAMVAQGTGGSIVNLGTIASS